MEHQFPNGRIVRWQIGDITKFAADALVNAANAALAGGGGVDGAIHRAGGPGIMKELDVIRAVQGGCPAGQAVATSAGDLPARFVFHAVGPIYRGGESGEAELLRSCYETCLRMAAEHQLRTIAFPSISTGAYGYPIREAAEIATGTVIEYLEQLSSSVQEVTFVLFGQRDYDEYTRVLRERLKR